MKPRPPIVLTVAGSDSGGEAGLQADLRTFAALGVHGATAVTCLTAQNRRAVSRIAPCAPAMLRAQLEAVFAGRPPAAAKTGMLYSAALVRETARFFKSRPGVPLVVDPVMIATSGRRLLTAGGLRALRNQLLPLATLATPNVAEAEALARRNIRSPGDLRAAARALHGMFGCAILAKGGHLGGTKEAVDFLFDGRNEWMLCAPRVAGIKPHGTGCVYSAAIAAGLARGMKLIDAVRAAKEFVTRHLQAQA